MDTQLYDYFCDLIEESRRWKIDTFTGDVSAPAFFFDELSIEQFGYDSDDPMPLPYDEFWLVFNMNTISLGGQQPLAARSGKYPHPVLDGATMAIFVTNNQPLGFTTYSYARGEGKRWGPFRLNKQPQMTLDVVNLARDYAIHLITDNEREIVDTPARVSVNRGRAKSKTALKPIPAFIRIGGPLRLRENGGGQHGTGSAKSPHERMGHYRNLSSGKRVWVRDCAIHGGSYVPRNYQVG